MHTDYKLLQNDVKMLLNAFFFFVLSNSFLSLLFSAKAMFKCTVPSALGSKILNFPSQ